MNQEKLAKLQAQVRIGGKVSYEWMHANIFRKMLFAVSQPLCYGLICYLSLLWFAGVSPQKEEGGAQNSYSR